MLQGDKTPTTKPDEISQCRCTLCGYLSWTRLDQESHVSLSDWWGRNVAVWITNPGSSGRTTSINVVSDFFLIKKYIYKKRFVFDKIVNVVKTFNPNKQLQVISRWQSTWANAHTWRFYSAAQLWHNAPDTALSQVIVALGHPVIALFYKSQMIAKIGPYIAILEV